jgi:hypothetical protein
LTRQQIFLHTTIGVLALAAGIAGNPRRSLPG